MTESVRRAIEVEEDEALLQEVRSLRRTLVRRVVTMQTRSWGSARPPSRGRWMGVWSR